MKKIFLMNTKKCIMRHVLMTFSLQLKSTLSLLVLIIVFIGCTDENVERQVDQIPIHNRTCEPGTYTISDGRLVFDDDYEFIETVEFLSCASLSEIDEWSREFELETAGKAYRNFMELVSDDELTDQEYDDLRNEYHGKILITHLR